jgi:hypothetical protein
MKPPLVGHRPPLTGTTPSSIVWLTTDRPAGALAASAQVPTHEQTGDVHREVSPASVNIPYLTIDYAKVVSTAFGF